MQRTSILPKQAVEEFRSIYSKQIGKKLSIEEAQVKAENFIQLFEIVTKNENEKQTWIHSHKE